MQSETEELTQTMQVQLNASQATSELKRINQATCEQLQGMYEEIEAIRQDEEMRDGSKYEH